MEQTTISVQNTGEFDNIQLEHDDRKVDENGKPYYSKNVDPSLSKNNWYWEGNMTVQEFYEREFEGAFSEQTEKIRATHPERLEGRKSTYYEQVVSEQIEAEKERDKLKTEGLSTKDINKKMSATTKVAYQTIVQIGDRESVFGTLQGTEEGREIAKKVMRDFLAKWQEKYPYMKLINVAIHADEIGRDGQGGTVHMHLTYCPVCTSYKKGMSVRNSLTGALKQMGYVADQKKDPKTGEFRLAVEKWQIDLRDTLEQMIAKYGYMRMKPEDTRTEHESIEDYGKRKDQIRKLEQEKAQLENKKAEVDASGEHIASQLEVIDQKVQNLQKREKEIVQREQILQTEAEASVKKLQKAISEATASVKSTDKRASEYPASLKKGCRIVPEKELEDIIEKSWFRPDYIKAKMQKVIDNFNDLPFVQTARQQIYNLQQQVLDLSRKIQRLTQKNKEQQAFIDKAKNLHVTQNQTVYDLVQKAMEQDSQRVREMYDHDSILD